MKNPPAELARDAQGGITRFRALRMPGYMAGDVSPRCRRPTASAAFPNKPKHNLCVAAHKLCYVEHRFMYCVWLDRTPQRHFVKMFFQSPRHNFASRGVSVLVFGGSMIELSWPSQQAVASLIS
jgi:hypothetical protein